MLQKIHLDKMNDTKNPLCFLSRAPTHHGFTFTILIRGETQGSFL